jgi:hypothetical protein
VVVAEAQGANSVLELDAAACEEGAKGGRWSGYVNGVMCVERMAA